MAIKEIIKYKTTDGKFYDNPKEAEKNQESINEKNLKSFSLETYETYIKKALEIEKKEGGNFFTRISQDSFDLSDAEKVFETLFIDYSDDLKGILATILHEGDRLPVKGLGETMLVRKVAG